MVLAPTPSCYGGTVPFPMLVMSVPPIVSGSTVVIALSRAPRAVRGPLQAGAGLALRNDIQEP